jgi:hypothetical protein
LPAETSGSSRSLLNSARSAAAAENQSQQSSCAGARATLRQTVCCSRWTIVWWRSPVGGSASIASAISVSSGVAL